MEPTPQTDVEREKLRLEQERLALERENRKQESHFLRRNSSVIIASFVPFIVAAISWTQVRTSNANDRRERLITYFKFINENVRELRTSDEVPLHRQTAYMTRAVLERDDGCKALEYIADRVAKNRTIRKIYDEEAATERCETTAGLGGAPQAHLVPVAAAGADEGPRAIRAIYVYREKNAAERSTDQVRRQLNELGYNVPGENDADSPITQNEIRYFNKRDAAAAAKVQAQLAKATGKSFVVNDYSSKNPGRPGFLEIYVAP